MKIRVLFILLFFFGNIYQTVGQTNPNIKNHKYTYVKFSNKTKLALLNNLKGYGYDTVSDFHYIIPYMFQFDPLTGRKMDVDNEYLNPYHIYFNKVINKLSKNNQYDLSSTSMQFKSILNLLDRNITLIRNDKRFRNNPVLQLKDLNAYLHTNYLDINKIVIFGQTFKEPDSLLGQFYYKLAVYFNRYKRENNKDIYYLRKAFNCFDKVSNLKMKHESLLKLGESFGHNYDFIFQEKSIQFYIEALTLANQIGNQKLILSDKILINNTLSKIKFSSNIEYSESEYENLDRLLEVILYKGLKSSSKDSKFKHILYLDLGNFYKNKLSYSQNEQNICKNRGNAEIAYITSIKSLLVHDPANLLIILNQYMSILSNDSNCSESNNKLLLLSTRLIELSEVLRGEAGKANAIAEVAMLKLNLCMRSKGINAATRNNLMHEIFSLLNESSKIISNLGESPSFHIESHFSRAMDYDSRRLLYSNDTLFLNDTIRYVLLRAYNNLESAFQSSKFNESTRIFSNYLENIMKADQEDKISLKNEVILLLNTDITRKEAANYILKQDSIQKELRLSNEILKREDEKRSNLNLLLILITLFVIIFSFILTLYSRKKSEKIKIESAKTEIEKKFALEKARTSYNSLNPHIIRNLQELITGIVTSTSLSNSDKRRFFDDIYYPYFNLILNIQENDFISISDELEALNKYFKIINYGNKLSFEVDIPNDLTFKVPPLIFQPMMENAIEHGFSDKNSANNKMILEIKKVSEGLEITFADNGIGIDPNWKSGRGTSIIRDRLNIYNDYIGQVCYKDLIFKNVDEGRFGFSSGTEINFKIINYE